MLEIISESNATCKKMKRENEGHVQGFIRPNLQL